MKEYETIKNNYKKVIEEHKEAINEYKFFKNITDMQIAELHCCLHSNQIERAEEYTYEEMISILLSLLCDLGFEVGLLIE
jgi:glucuronate isomerase